MKRILTVFTIFILTSSCAFAKKKEAVIIPGESGYVGTLPNLEEQFKSSQEQEAKPTFDYQEGFNDPDAIKPAPRNNPSFVNIIIKRDKTSKYVNDLNELIFIIEGLQDLVEDKANVQRFNAKAYFLKESAENFRDKYRNRAEESFISYKKVMQLNSQVQTLAQLRRESEVYSPYVTAQGSGNIFSKNNIDNQLNYLNEEIKKTLVILKETK